MRLRIPKLALMALLLTGAFFSTPFSLAQSDSLPAVIQNAPLPLEQVVQNLEAKNQERAQALHEFEGTRIYRMQYRGFPSNRDAEMVVNMTYQSPETKQFTVVSQSGSKFIIDHVFKKLLEGEQEAAKEENRRRTAVNRENYEFSLAGYETAPNGAQYVLSVLPKNKNKFLYRGKIWVDGKDFAITRIEAEPAKNPSFWIRKTEIEHKYIKVNDFWLPVENRSESFIKLGGKAVLSIEYTNYKITEAAHPGSDNGKGQAARLSENLNGIPCGCCAFEFSSHINFSAIHSS